VGFEIVGELSHDAGIAPVGGIEHAAPVDIDEQRDAVVAAARGGLVDGDALDASIVGALTRLLTPVVEDAPQPCVVLTLRRAAAATGIAVMSVMASASNSRVKPEPGLAQGTAICLTPQSGQAMHGVRACRKA
jgi:hypothetical protein